MSTRLQRIEEICRERRVKALYVFGSRSSEIYRVIQDETIDLQPSLKDVDIGILTHALLSIDEKISLSSELEELFDTPRVDLVIMQDADPFLAVNIIRGERIYAEDAHFMDEYELFVLRRAGDLTERERERISMILHRG
ncbi:MAG TPA: nucleotidyltransferase domain-containing protein [Anaerolineales bacterium]|nr:nucleotidyltransferase domain-containing protein [Anaerolineales bacterium]